MCTPEERAAVLALTRATSDRPWHHTSRVVTGRRSAKALMDGDFTGLDEDDRAHAIHVVTRLRPGDLTWAGHLIAAMRAEGVHLVTVLDESYPGNLYDAYNRQPVLWIRGRLSAQDLRAVAVVGERDAGHAVQAARALARAGSTVVAGLRSDLDAAVHEAALACGGRTIAVLAGGIASPAGLGQYATVAKEIATGGAVVSPFWPDTMPSDETSALSRVVISGLAGSLYVVDGRDNGLSQRQAEVALDHGTHVFVPHSLHQTQQWVATVGFRGGITVVQDIDDLTRQTVNLIDMCRQTTTF
ncbi:hypothetical protein Sme01_19430 [Sphaerisporangium melleum]|uniref:Smf/DprA SLOG domain-containing protein n=1 Tax=Sphaerisporangium melleum TaxID=321316 RepID=A0A917RE13_9ACTN|nr:DNA-processing protein DprA [Sphaerisporangium melleum]GGL02895.1 hypothetical protein GCM10007964_51210 [Sphaerisporangium melleum]GII69467.1 hypothetical protein Sme01_19430 [Sphaerisporangium melleum]